VVGEYFGIGEKVEHYTYASILLVWILKIFDFFFFIGVGNFDETWGFDSWGFLVIKDGDFISFCNSKAIQSFGLLLS
jgi:hypothetical protein